MAPPAELHAQLVALLPRLRRFARTLTRNVHDADDLVQVAIERALTRAEQLQADAPLAGWMYGIVRNAWIDEVRTRERHTRLLTPEVGESLVSRVSGPTDAEQLAVQECAGQSARGAAQRGGAGADRGTVLQGGGLCARRARRHPDQPPGARARRAAEAARRTGTASMTFDDETVMAYVDGELEPPARAALEAAMAGDPQLAQRVEAQRALRARLQRACAPLLDEPVPERLLSAARGEPQRATVLPLRAREPVRRWSWPQWSAIAASLVMGALFGPLLLRSSAGPVTTRDGRLLAAGALAQALSQQLASTQAPDTAVRIGLSFRTRDGSYCRSFLVRAPSPLAGVACREPDAWRMQLLAAAAPDAAAGAYRPAAAAMPAAVTQAVDALIAGEPLDAAAEAAARSRAWGR